MVLLQTFQGSIPASGSDWEEVGGIFVIISCKKQELFPGGGDITAVGYVV